MVRLVKFAGLLTLGIAAVAAGIEANRLPSATGLAARQLCSLHYASGMEADFVRKTWIDPHLRPVSGFIRLKKDDATRTTQATLLGLFKAKAKYRADGHGCVLDFGEKIVRLDPVPLKAGVRPLPNVANFDATKLASALDDAFTEPTAEENRQTVAIVVLHKGELVAEKVHDKITINTPLPGYSMAKSMTATMVGLLVQNEGLDVHSIVPDAGDLTEAGVTYDHLLRMVSGIDVLEDGSGRDANSIMLTRRHDAGGYAIKRGLKATPGEHYAYTGGGPLVLAKAFRDHVPHDGPSGAFAYIHEHLTRPLGLTSLVLESDGTGTFLGSTYMSASAYDWAKLGQLYLQDGVWNGVRILPEGWTDYVCTATPQSGKWAYGAGFWTGKDGGKDASWADKALLPPEDACFMHGMMNQSVYIIPSRDLVIVRLGATRAYRESGELELVRDVIAAMES